MKRFWAPVAAIALLVGTLIAQEVDIRNPVINTESPAGQLITDAMNTEDLEERISLLESFAADHADHGAMPFVHFQLQGAYLQRQDFVNALRHGEAVLEVDPEDLEVRHNFIKTLEGQRDWQRLLGFLKETKPLADAEAAAQLPEDAYEDEEAEWQAQVDYAKGVLDYIEYSLYSASVQSQDPNLKKQYLDTRAETFPEGKYSAQIHGQYFRTYQQLGQFPGMVEAAIKGIEAEPNNPDFLNALGEHYLGAKDFPKVHEYADRLIQVSAEAPKPDNVDAAAWEKQQALYGALGKSLKGRAIIFNNTADAKQPYRDGRAIMLEAVGPLEEMGGPSYGTLAYFLGFCYVKLDIGCDNWNQVQKWLGTASQLPPFQSQAADLLGKAREGCG